MATTVSLVRAVPMVGTIKITNLTPYPTLTSSCAPCIGMQLLVSV